MLRSDADLRALRKTIEEFLPEEIKAASPSISVNGTVSSEERCIKNALNEFFATASKNTESKSVKCLTTFYLTLLVRWRKFLNVTGRKTLKNLFMTYHVTNFDRYPISSVVVRFFSSLRNYFVSSLIKLYFYLGGR